VRLTKYTHSCVRIEHEGHVLVIDPGIWSEPHVLFDAEAVLVTHEHTDHIDVLRLAGLGVPVFLPEGAGVRGLPATTVSAGETFSAGAFDVLAVGGDHAKVYGDQPACANLGYIINGTTYHPGDSFHLPPVEVETLLIPIQASWMSTRDAIDFGKAIHAEQSFPIHDGQMNDRGLRSIKSWLEREVPGYRHLAPGETA